LAPTNECQVNCSWFAIHRLGFANPEDIVGGVAIRLSWTYVPQLTAVLAGSFACQAAKSRNNRERSNKSINCLFAAPSPARGDVSDIMRTPSFL
jgi:hypothetical protein